VIITDRKAGIAVNQVPILTFFAPQGQTASPTFAKFGREEGTKDSLLLQSRNSESKCRNHPFYCHLVSLSINQS